MGLLHHTAALLGVSGQRTDHLLYTAALFGGQWAVGLLLYAAALLGSSGQCVSFSTLPHSWGAVWQWIAFCTLPHCWATVGRGAPSLHRHRDGEQWAVDLLQ